jgi:hypothetical protein
MTTHLSSRLTFFFKFCFPAVWGGLWSYLTYQMFSAPDQVAWIGGGTPPPWAKWFCLALLAVGGYICHGCYVLKRVDLDSRGLLISNYWKSVRIPLAEVSRAGIDGSEAYEVEATVGLIGLRESRPTCILELRHETAFGRVIEFIPRSRDAIKLLRARLGPAVGALLQEPTPAPPPPSEPDEFRGRGTV